MGERCKRDPAIGKLTLGKICRQRPEGVGQKGQDAVFSTPNRANPCGSVVIGEFFGITAGHSGPALQ